MDGRGLDRPSLAALGPEQKPLCPASLVQHGLRTHLPGAPAHAPTPTMEICVSTSVICQILMGSHKRTACIKILIACLQRTAATVSILSR